MRWCSSIGKVELHLRTPQRYARAIAHAYAQPFADSRQLWKNQFFLSAEFICVKCHIKLGTRQEAITIKQQQVRAIVKTAPSTPVDSSATSTLRADLVVNAMTLA